MIIVKLQGGLGNQMFQYATARAVAERNKTDLGIDISWFDRYKNNLVSRKYVLHNFNISGRLLKTGIFYRILSKLVFLEDLRPIQKRYYIKEKKLFQFDSEILNVSKNVYVDGYWQNEKYFKGIEGIIKKEFTLKNLSSPLFCKLSNEMVNSKSVSIHIRRGDYIHSKETNKVHGVCSLNYYNQAIKIINGSVKDPTFFVFSDEIDWAKNNLKLNYPTFFVSNKLMKDGEELILMSKCRHNIIANSSFSWWGAWLSENPHKIVIAPKQWFSKERMKKRGESNIIPKDWITI